MPTPALLPVLAPLLLLATAALALRWPGRRPAPLPVLAEAATLVALACAVA